MCHCLSNRGRYDTPSERNYTDQNRLQYGTFYIQLEMSIHTFFIWCMQQNIGDKLMKSSVLFDFESQGDCNKDVFFVMIGLFVCLIAIKAQKRTSLASTAIFHAVLVQTGVDVVSETYTVSIVMRYFDWYFDEAQEFYYNFIFSFLYYLPT